jgi:SAM-dependent methyltransferase
MSDDLRDVISGHYGGGYEAQRLAQGTSRLEMARTLELLKRFLPAAPAVVLDVGGGPGAYACELLEAGYTVQLSDITPLHVDQAMAAFAKLRSGARGSARVGDARKLTEADSSADAVLLLGPLYHLTERADRIQALKEASRVLKPGGVLVAAVITRFASVLDGLRGKLLDDPAFVKIVEQDLKDGQHRNPTGNPEYFTSAFLHRVEDLRDEIAAAGLALSGIFGVEGPAWLIPGFDEHWSDAGRRERMLAAVRAIEQEPSLLGVSAHLLGVARKA